MVRNARGSNTFESAYSAAWRLTNALAFPCKNRQIWIMDQATVTSLCGLEELVHLRVLNVTQCNIKKIECLENLTSLKKLFLFNNEIKTMENIGHLTSLEVNAQC